MKHINPWNKDDRSVSSLIKAIFTRQSDKETELIQDIRSRILNYIVKLGVIAGLFSLIAGLLVAYEKVELFQALVMVIIYLLFLTLILFPGIKYEIRANMMLMCIFALSTILVLSNGLISDSTLWMITFVLTATILHGKKGLIYSLSLIFVLLSIVIMGIPLNWWSWLSNYNITTIESISISIDLLFLSFILSVSLLLLIRGLTNSLIIAKETQEKLEEQDEVSRIAIASLRAEIEDRILVENELKNSERRLKNAQSIAKIASWELDLNKTLYWGTEEFFKIIGYKSNGNHIEFETFNNLCHPEDLEYRLNAITSLSTESGKIDIKYRIRRISDGEIRWVHSIGELITDLEGKPLRYSGTLQDVTQDMLWQQELIQREFQLKTLFNNASISILILKGHVIVDCNPRTEKLFGTSREYLIGNTPIKLSPEYQPDGRTSENAAQDYISKALNGQSQVFEWKHFKSNGTMCDVEVSLSRVMIKDEFLLQAFLVDISERKENERTITRLNRELELRVIERTQQLEFTLEDLKFENEHRKRTEEELVKIQDDLLSVLSKEKHLNELKSRFISMVSHEYRTPLTVILSSTYILDTLFIKNDYEPFKKNIEQIRQSIQSLTKLLDDVLIYERPGSKNWQQTFGILEVVSFIRSLVEEIRLSSGKNRNIIINSSVNQIKLECDNSSMRYVISNLIANSIKYSPPSTPVEVNIIDDTSHVYIMIKDYGIGIPSDDIKSIFNPFHRSKNIGTTPGTGLGLAIVKRYVDIMNGSISVESNESEGTLFTLKFEK